MVTLPARVKIVVDSILNKLFRNCIVLGALGIVLELIHGPVRVGAIYTLGVITGGILALVVTPCQSLVGASGGCYALMAAFIANGIMNMDVMDTIVKLLHFLPVSIFLLVDVGHTFYMENTNSGYRVSWAAHLGGVVAGLNTVFNSEILNSKNSNLSYFRLARWNLHSKKL